MEEKLNLIDLNLNNLKSYNDTFANNKTIQFNRLVKSLYEETKEMIQQIKTVQVLYQLGCFVHAIQTDLVQVKLFFKIYRNKTAI